MLGAARDAGGGEQALSGVETLGPEALSGDATIDLPVLDGDLPQDAEACHRFRARHPEPGISR